jgi:hypothetical protein
MKKLLMTATMLTTLAINPAHATPVFQPYGPFMVAIAPETIVNMRPPCDGVGGPRTPGVGTEAAPLGSARHPHHAQAKGR